MEDSLMRVLELTTARIVDLVNKAKGFNDLVNTCIPDNVILEAEVNASKLESSLKKLENDLNNYFRYVNEPAVDEVSKITTVQLEAEEALCELRVILKRYKPSTSAENTTIATGKLPKLILPEFHGDILHWHQFWDQFTSLVDSRRLNDVDKFLYLTSSLRGEAKELVEGLVATNENYSIAVGILKARYGRIELVKDTHYSALNKIIPANTSIENCRRVLNEIERHFRVLSALGEDTSHSYFRFLILEKFPEDLVYELKKRTKEDSVSEIRKELEDLISAREDASRVTNRKETNSSSSSYTTETLYVTAKPGTSGYKRIRSHNPQSSSSSSNLPKHISPHRTPKGTSLKRKMNAVCSTIRETSSSPARPIKRTKKHCIFCTGDHFGQYCKKYTTAEERRSRINNLCFKCLRSGHIIRNCQLKKPCRNCGNRSHNVVFCPQYLRNTKGEAAKPAKDDGVKPIRKDNTKQFHIKDNGVTILQTAIVGLSRESNQDAVKCRALLDSGSQRTYVTRELAKKLNLATIEESKLTVFTFGTTEPQEIESPRVRFLMSTRSGESITINANVVPMITQGVPHLAVDQGDWTSKFNLADDGSLADRVDLLIGNDYYFSLILTEKVKIQENLYLVNSELGWIVSGKTEITPVNELSVVTYFQTGLEMRLSQPDLPLSDTNIKELWELEAIGISDSPKENREEEALRHFNETTQFKDGRYQVSWPWVEYPPDLKPNYGLALGRLVSFLQVGLQIKDRDVTRFLWVKDIRRPVDDTNLLHMRFRRVPFGVISSPFLLNATIKYHLSRSSLDSMRNLAQEIYVDNMVTGTETSREAINLYENAKKTFQQMSMNLRDWSSNSKNFIKHIPDACQDEVVKVLGLDWDLRTDTLRLRFKEREFANTKRGVLKSIASVYDPSGYVAPSMLPAKLFLQELWKKKIKWDTTLSKDMTDRWKDIQKDLRNLKEVYVPRCYVRDLRNKEYEIHCFADSSIKAYAAVVYIVQDNKRSFVIGKSRLVPVKDHDVLKIPRLELLSFLIGHRLIQYVKKFLPNNVSQQVLWTDSQIVISWYHSDKLLAPFVARRIKEVKGNKELTVRYIPTDLNPADVATRPGQPREKIEKWLAGPDFLSKKPSEWPSYPKEVNSLLIGEGLPNTPREEDRETSERMNTSDVTAKKVMDSDCGIIYTTVDEIKDIQTKYFPDELAGKETSMKRNLDLFKDEDGVLRCKGRFKNANWTYDKSYPILLPQDSEYTDNIIMKTHNDNYHVGASHTLSIVRQSFWIPQGKRQVIKVIKKCPQCIKHGGGPFKLPPTPALPPERVNYTEPYTYTGIDYMGPILIKTRTGTEKRWICLFTCLAVRAIHLEVVRDLTAEEGLLALRRFVSTRNVPAVITSDNATNFKLMSEVLSQPYCVERKIKWRFIPQLAPWFGGFYERLVGIVKNCLKRTLQKHLLTDNQLNTIVKELEAVVNSRPLTYVDEEPTHILKPSDFIAMGRTIVIDTTSEGPLPQGTQTKVDLINSWRKGMIVLDEFKEMFTNRYLLSLRERYSHSHKQPRCTSTSEPFEGQIVQIKGDSKNRENWQVGKIVSLTKGADDKCRVARVKVGNKEYTRSISHLYPLEVEEDTNGDNASSPIDKENETSNDEETQDVGIDIEDVEMIEHSRIHSEREQVNPTDTESINEETTQIRVNSPIDTDISCANADDTTGASPGQRPQRDAAIIARKRIRQWTTALTSLLLAAGSVVNRATYLR